MQGGGNTLLSPVDLVEIHFHRSIHSRPDEKALKKVRTSLSENLLPIEEEVAWP